MYKLNCETKCLRPSKIEKLEDKFMSTDVSTKRRAGGQHEYIQVWVLSCLLFLSRSFSRVELECRHDGSRRVAPEYMRIELMWSLVVYRHHEKDRVEARQSIRVASKRRMGEVSRECVYIERESEKKKEDDPGPCARILLARSRGEKRFTTSSIVRRGQRGMQEEAKNTERELVVIQDGDVLLRVNSHEILCRFLFYGTLFFVISTVRRENKCSDYLYYFFLFHSLQCSFIFVICYNE